MKNLLQSASSGRFGLEHPGLQVNSNGSVDLDFGPAPPDGQQTNWIPTKADGRFEALCRLYGPQQPFFDKIWKLPDIQRVH